MASEKRSINFTAFVGPKLAWVWDNIDLIENIAK